jgi:hypothetical protein
MVWSEMVARCQKAAEGFEPYHKWVVISKQKTPTSEFVNTIMCGICFSEVNISEARTFRTSENPDIS